MEENNNIEQKSGKDYYREKFPELYNTPSASKPKPKVEKTREIENNVKKIDNESGLFGRPLIKKDISGDLSRQFQSLQSKFNFKDMKNKETKKQYAKIIVFYLIIMYVLFLLLNNLIIPAIVHSRALVTVPNIIGYTEKNAKDKLNGIDLEWEVVTEQFNEDTRPGLVLKQDPKPGIEVKSGRPVYLTISKGREAVEVPNLKGLTMRNVEIKLMNFGLKIGKVDSMYSNEFARNIIIKQWPNPGEQIYNGKAVNVTICLGSSNKVMVPKVVGFALDGIYQFIEENGLTLGNVIYEKSETYQTHIIIYQFPTAGDSVQRGTPINITVAQ